MHKVVYISFLKTFSQYSFLEENYANLHLQQKMKKQKDD